MAKNPLNNKTVFFATTCGLGALALYLFNEITLP